MYICCRGKLYILHKTIVRKLSLNCKFFFALTLKKNAKSCYNLIIKERKKKNACEIDVCTKHAYSVYITTI